MSAHSTPLSLHFRPKVATTRRSLIRNLAWFVAGFAILGYSWLAAPGIITLFDDSLEFQVVGPTFGIAHPTGYPLYTLLGGLWSRLLWPFGNWAWRMNLFSALAAGTAVGMVYQIGRMLADRLLTGSAASAMVGLVAALLFAVLPVWVEQATVAEVYALHGAFVAAILLVAFWAGRHPTSAGAGKNPITQPGLLPQQALRLRWLALLCGLSLAHHRTTLLLLPPLLLFLLLRVPNLWRPQRLWFELTTLGLAPLLLYLYIPIRAAAGVRDLHGSYTNTWTGFWDHVLARGYLSFFSENPLAIARPPQTWGLFLLEQVGALGLTLALLGLLLWPWRQRQHWPEWLLVVSMIGSNIGFAWAYQVHDAEVFMLPALLGITLLAAAGAATLQQLAQLRPAGLLALLLITASLLLPDGRTLPPDRRHDWQTHHYAQLIGNTPFPPNSRLIALEGEVTALRYMQQEQGLGLNAQPIVADDPTLRRTAIATSVAAGYPTYLTREVEGIGQLYSFTGAGPLVRVWPRGQANAGLPEHLLDELMPGAPLRLAGYSWQPHTLPGGAVYELVLFWQPQAPLEQTLKLSLRLQGLDGAPLYWADRQPAVLDLYPLRQTALTTEWLPEETIADVYYLDQPDAPSEPLAQLQVIVYDAESVEEVGRWEQEIPLY